MKTMIEAGHYYQVQGPSNASMQGWEIGKELAASMPQAELALFIDDYHERQDFMVQGDSFLEPEDAELAVKEMKETASMVLYESDFASIAAQQISQLHDEGLVKEKQGVFKVGGVRLGCLRRCWN